MHNSQQPDADVTKQRKQLELTMIDTLDIMTDVWLGQSFSSTCSQFEILSIEPETTANTPSSQSEIIPLRATYHS